MKETRIRAGAIESGWGPGFDAYTSIFASSNCIFLVTALRFGSASILRTLYAISAWRWVGNGILMSLQCHNTQQSMSEWAKMTHLPSAGELLTLCTRTDSRPLYMVYQSFRIVLHTISCRAQWILNPICLTCFDFVLSLCSSLAMRFMCALARQTIDGANHVNGPVHWSRMEMLRMKKRQGANIHSLLTQIFILFIHRIATQFIYLLNNWIHVASLLATLLHQFGESTRDQQRCIDESFHTIGQTRFGFAVQFAARRVNALFPANLIEFVNLRTK